VPGIISTARASAGIKFSVNLNKAQGAAVEAAKAAGAIMRRNLRAEKAANEITAHDIKLVLDVRCQKLIEKKLHAAFPAVSFLGEEGDSGAADSEYRWVVDPIDGTVNFAYGIPHACVSIALQVRSPKSEVRSKAQSSPSTIHPPITHETVLGVIYDPFCDELWTAIRGGPARLNGRVICVSRRTELSDTIVTVGFGKSRVSLGKSLPYFNWLARRVRKIRIMGSAALGLAYLATGRFDAYIERGVSLWDIAAGGLIVECAGGKFRVAPTPGKHKFRMVASNGLVHAALPEQG
jgi:myo-inositol-1(or 4)-monophosphatase